MLLFDQLELPFSAPSSPLLGRDSFLEMQARELLNGQGAAAIAGQVQVIWSARLQSGAGRVNLATLQVLLNPRLIAYGQDEVDRTLRHELAHLLAHFRAGRRRIAPHGLQWRRACADLEIPNESRCHTLPFPVRRRRARFLYICPNCQRDFPRTRSIRRPTACLACCRKFNRGDYDGRFRLRLANR